MDSPTTTTAERVLSKTKEEIIKEAKRIEESLLYSSKGHFAAANRWGKFHFIVGLPAVVLASVSGASAVAAFAWGKTVAAICSVIVTMLSALLTFLNPNERARAHLNAGNNYDALMNRARIFWSIDCWRDESEQVLTEKLKYLSEQKDRLNQSCPQIPRWAYRKAKKGIESGEGDYQVDKARTQAVLPAETSNGDQTPKLQR